MARPKGDGKGRLGGRKAGTPNKVTKEQREIITKFIEGKWDDFIAAYDAIEKPVEKCNVMLGLLQYAVPKLASVEYKDKVAGKTLQDELDEISGEKTRK